MLLDDTQSRFYTSQNLVDPLSVVLQAFVGEVDRFRVGLLEHFIEIFACQNLVLRRISLFYDFMSYETL